MRRSSVKRSTRLGERYRLPYFVGRFESGDYSDHPVRILLYISIQIVLIIGDWDVPGSFSLYSASQLVLEWEKEKSMMGLEMLCLKMIATWYLMGPLYCTYPTTVYREYPSRRGVMAGCILPARALGDGLIRKSDIRRKQACGTVDLNEI